METEYRYPTDGGNREPDVARYPSIPAKGGANGGWWDKGWWPK